MPSEFDRILGEAATFVRQTPLIRELMEIEIARLAQYQYASMLEEDEEVRREGSGSEKVFQEITQQLANQSAPFATPFATGGHGASGCPIARCLRYGRMWKGHWWQRGQPLLVATSPSLRTSWMSCFTFSASTWSAEPAYRQLGAEVLKAYVRALEATARRNEGGR